MKVREPLPVGTHCATFLVGATQTGAVKVANRSTMLPGICSASSAAFIPMDTRLRTGRPVANRTLLMASAVRHVRCFLQHVFEPAFVENLCMGGEIVDSVFVASSLTASLQFDRALSVGTTGIQTSTVTYAPGRSRWNSPSLAWHAHVLF